MPADAPVPEARLKLGSQEGRIPGKSLRAKAEILATWGGKALELHGRAEKLASRVASVKKDLAGTGVVVSAICAGYFPLVDPKPEKRKAGVQELKDTLGPAGEMESTGVIVVPAFNKHDQLDRDEGFQVLVDLLPEVGDHAARCGTRILFEPLNKGEARFMNRLEQAVKVCEAVKHPAVCMMGDFYHMAKEETDDEAAFVQAGRWCRHVHLASRVRWLPGQDHLKEPEKSERSFVAGFRGLKRVGYRDYMSLECRCEGKPEVEIPACFRFLEREWKEAVV